MRRVRTIRLYTANTTNSNHITACWIWWLITKTQSTDKHVNNNNTSHYNNKMNNSILFTWYNYYSPSSHRAQVNTLTIIHHITKNKTKEFNFSFFSWYSHRSHKSPLTCSCHYCPVSNDLGPCSHMVPNAHTTVVNPTVGNLEGLHCQRPLL